MFMNNMESKMSKGVQYSQKLHHSILLHLVLVYIEPTCWTVRYQQKREGGCDRICLLPDETLYFSFYIDSGTLQLHHKNHCITEKVALYRESNWTHSTENKALYLEGTENNCTHSTGNKALYLEGTENNWTHASHKSVRNDSIYCFVASTQDENVQ